MVLESNRSKVIVVDATVAIKWFVTEENSDIDKFSIFPIRIQQLLKLLALVSL